MEEDKTVTEGTETPTTDAGDGLTDGDSQKGDIIDHPEIGGEGVVDHPEIIGEGADELQGEHVEGEHLEGEQLEGEQLEGEQLEGEQLEGEQLEGEQKEGEKQEEKPPEEEKVEEEEQFVEEPPPDPCAPYNLTDSKEALKEPFELRPEQVAEIELLWEVFQDYTPAYTDIDNYITEKELAYMLKSLLLMTFTPEQFLELIAYCVRPPHPEGHITYEQFLKMVTIRQREFMIEDELRAALQVYDPEKTGMVSREYLREVLGTIGYKLPTKQIESLIKEVDMANDGTLGIEDIIGTMCIDLNKEDMQMLRDQAYPKPLVIEEPEEN